VPRTIRWWTDSGLAGQITRGLSSACIVPTQRSTSRAVEIEAPLGSHTGTHTLTTMRIPARLAGVAGRHERGKYQCIPGPQGKQYCGPPRPSHRGAAPNDNWPPWPRRISHCRKAGREARLDPDSQRSRANFVLRPGALARTPTPVRLARPHGQPRRPMTVRRPPRASSLTPSHLSAAMAAWTLQR